MLGLTQHERNALEDTKRVVQQLKKCGNVDQVHRKALKELFENEAFLSEVRQWMLSKRATPSSSNSSQDDLEELTDIALAALVGLLAGTAYLQPAPSTTTPATAQAASAAVAAPRPSTPVSLQQIMQSVQQPGQRASGQQRLPQHLPQRLPAAAGGRQQLQQRRRQQECEISAAEDLELKLRGALINMYEQEELLLQARFKQYYSEHMQQLQQYRTHSPPDFTQEAPKNVYQSPDSPSKAYHGGSWGSEQIEQQQQQQQHGLSAGSVAQQRH